MVDEEKQLQLSDLPDVWATSQSTAAQSNQLVVNNNLDCDVGVIVYLDNPQNTRTTTLLPFTKSTIKFEGSITEIEIIEA